MMIKISLPGMIRLSLTLILLFFSAYQARDIWIQYQALCHDRLKNKQIIEQVQLKENELALYVDQLNELDENQDEIRQRLRVQLYHESILD